MSSEVKTEISKPEVVSEPEEGAITDSGGAPPEKVIVMTKRRSGVHVGAVTLDDLSRKRERKIIIIERDQKSLDDKRRVEVVRIRHGGGILAQTVEGRIIDKHLREAADSMILIKKRRREDSYSPPVQRRRGSRNSTPE